MPSQEEFESISQTIESILGEKKQSDEKRVKEKEEEYIHQEMQNMITELELKILEEQKAHNKGTSSPPKSKIPPIPEQAVRGYVIPVGAVMMVPV